MDKTITSREEELISQIERYFRYQPLDLPPFWKFGDSLRFIYEFDWDFEQIIENLGKHLKWIGDLPVSRLTAGAKDILDFGVVYLCGRDKQYRPNLYVNLTRIIDFESKPKIQFLTKISPNLT